MVISTANTSPLDWVNLSGNIEGAYSWIKTLFTEGQAIALLEPNAVQEQQLWHFFWEQRTARRLRGRQELFFTYPFFVSSEEEAFRNVPLLRWPCVLEPPTVARPQWKVQVDADKPVQQNLAWAAWADTKYPNDWAAKLSACLPANQDSLKRLSDFVLALSEHTPWTMDTISPAITASNYLRAGNEGPEDITDGQLRWSARLELMTDNWEELFELPVYWRQPLTHEESNIGDLSLAALNPHQYQAFRQVHSQRYVLVEGGQGTGKSHSVLELIKLSLAQGKRCLVVAAERNSLIRIQTALSKKQLDKLSFLWQDEKNDLPILQGLINSFEKQQTIAADYDELQWRTDLARANRHQRQLNEWYHSSRKAVFGDKSWSELLGYYLEVSRQEDKALLVGQLQAQQFVFEPKEYHDIIESINTTRPLYEQLGTVHHPLQNLSAAIFIHQDVDESRSFILDTSRQFLERAQPLHHKFVQQQSSYADELATYHESYYLLLRTQLQQLEEQLEDSQNAFGSDTMRSGDRTLKLYGQFSEKYKKALEERNAIAETYEALQTLHQERDMFSFDWPNDKIKKILPTLRSTLINYRQELENWRNSLSTQLQDELIRLNHKTALPELMSGGTIESLEEELEVFADELNASGLYQLPLHSKTLTLARQQKFLEEVIDQLERTQEGLGQFEDFHAWQRNWFSLSEISRKSIQALLRSRPENWSAAFSSWYFYECLHQQYDPFPVLPEDVAENYSREVELLRQQLPQVIQKNWVNRRKQSQSKLKGNLKNWPDKLSKLPQEDAALLADVYPIAMANPRLGNLLAPHYELIIIENAGSLTSDDAAGILSKAEQLAVFANPAQVGDQYKELVSLLRKGDIPTVKFAFPEVATLPNHWNQRSEKIQVHQLDGRFDEEAQTNEVEALEVLRLLNTIAQTPQKTFPKVGVIALTMEQRDRILQLFYRIKKERSPGAELIQQLERNGLQVLYGNDAISQEFDILFVSTVYGPIDHQGHLSSMISMLNEDFAYASLNILESVLSDSDHVHFLNSIPVDELEERLNWEDRPGERYLARILLLAQAEANQNHSLIESLSACWEEGHIASPEKTLDQELILRMSALLPNWKWTVEVPKGIRQSVVIAESPEGQRSILLTDGFVSGDRYTVHDWEAWQRYKLGLAKYQIVNYSSEQLWKNTDRCCRKIARQLTETAPLTEEE